MKNITEIINKMFGNNRVFKEALVLEKLKVIWPQIMKGEMLGHTEVCDYKNKVLFIETTSSTWSQQIIFFKQDIINRIKKTLPEVICQDIKTRNTGKIKNKAATPVQVFLSKNKEEENRVEFFSTASLPQSRDGGWTLENILRKQKVLRKNDKRRSCPICGKRYLGTEKVCIFCSNENLKDADIKIMNYISESPWSKYEDIKKDLPETDEGRYYKIREKVKNKAYDQITSIAYEYNRNRTKKLREVLRKKIFKYTLLKTCLTPEKINGNIIKGKINSKLYKAVYEDCFGERA